jgi:hypothetical protein
MKIQSLFRKISLSIVGTSICLTGIAQVNSSTEDNYKERSSTVYEYSTKYDNGYTTLRDGTVLTGKISLVGDAYEKLQGVKIRTSGGDKHLFALRSLSEYGLSNSLVNDTPDLFSWGELSKKTPLTGFNAVRTGYNSFGYVNTQEGKLFEGRIWVKESNGRIEQITVTGSNKKTTKIEADNVVNFGAKRYIDEKFEGVWAMIPWAKSIGSGLLVNTKSVPVKGVVKLKSGQVHKGFITLVKKGQIIIQIQVRAGQKGKPIKIKYPEVASYYIEQQVEDYYEILKSFGDFEYIHPSRKFHPGTVTLQDGTVHQGLVAKDADKIYSDIYFVKDENDFVQGFAAEDVEDLVQDIPEQVMIDFKKFIYNAYHVKGYKIQAPSRWVYKNKNDNGYKTEFQQGYFIMTSGEIKIGAISVVKQGTITKYFIKEAGKEEVKYSGKEVGRAGLIENEARTAFPESMYREKRKGFIVQTGSVEVIQGTLEITAKTRSTSGNVVTELVVDGTAYDKASIEKYGLIDVPVRELTGDGVVIYDDPKQNFHPGSYTENGVKKSGWIAWYKPNDAGEYETFFFADKEDGTANVCYVSLGATDVIQNIQEDIEAYDPLNDSFLATTTIDKDVKNNGYVVTATGEKIEGAVQMSFPPKLWFATDVILTRADGTVENYTNDGSLQQVVITIDGKQQEFVNFENEYVEVLHRDGDLVHFRNPHPTTPTTLNRMMNDFGSAMMDAATGEIANKLAENRAKAVLAGNWDEDKEESYQNYANRDKRDWSDHSFVTLYEKEYLIYNTATGRRTMYYKNKVNPFYLQTKAELTGCIEYITLENAEKRGLNAMRNPLETLKFINENMNN